MKKYRVKHLIGLLLVAGLFMLAACGGGGTSAPAPEPDKGPVIFSNNGISVEVPEGCYAMVPKAYGDIFVYGVEQKAVEEAKDARDLDRVTFEVYDHKRIPKSLGGPAEPANFASVKEAFTVYYATITGTTPAAEMTIGDYTFVYTDTAVDGVDAYVMATVVDGYAMSVKLIGETFKDSDQAKEIVKKMTFNAEDAFKE